MQKEQALYLNWKAGYTEVAHKRYESYLRGFRIFLKGKKVQEVSLHDIAKWQHLISTKYANANVYYAVVIIKNFFRYLRAQNYRVIDPWLIKLPKYVTRKRQAVTSEEYQLMCGVLGELRYEVLRRRTALSLLWDTGVRVRELVEMNLADLDHIRQRAIIKNRKNKNYRVVRWGSETNETLVQYLGIRLALCRNEALFVSQRGTRIGKRVTTRTIERWVRTISKNAGLRPITPHLLRHGWAVLRRKQKADLAFLQKGMGHQSPNSTMVYIQYEDPELEQELEKYL